ncbi:MAG TPA: dihydroorotase, partial [Flavisolibacter sp.]
DIELAKYTSSRLHITGVSTAASVALIRAAKQEGVAISCSVTPYHLFFTDEDLTGYDTNLKVNPPLRTKADRDALREAVLEGHIDCITSHHLPEDPDHKQVEFEYAAFGMSGLETSFAIARTALPGLSLDALVDLFSRNARKLFPLPDSSIRKDAPASLTLFHPDSEWQPRSLQSRSKNTPFTGRTLTGRPAGIINKDTLFLNQLV